MNPTPVLKVDSIHHSFGKNQVLRGIHLECAPGEVIGLLGRNGSGKTTLLRIILGLIRSYQGTVRLDGELALDGVRTRKIAYLSQHSFLPRQLSVRSCGRLLNCDEVSTIGSLREVLGESTLGAKVANLSQGQRRLVEFILLCSLNRPLLLLDEPFAQIDPIHTGALKRAIHNSSRIGGIVIADHDYRNVLDVSTRIVLLRDGCGYAARTEADLAQLGYLPRRPE